MNLNTRYKKSRELKVGDKIWGVFYKKELLVLPTITEGRIVDVKIDEPRVNVVMQIGDATYTARLYDNEPAASVEIDDEDLVIYLNVGLMFDAMEERCSEVDDFYNQFREFLRRDVMEIFNEETSWKEGDPE